jgi:hypothetical protein
MGYIVTHERETCPKHGFGAAECDENCEYVLEVYQIEGSVSRYIPARVSGPPENCYPAEGGEVEIEEAWLDAPSGRVQVDWEKHFTSKELDEIEQRLFDAAMDDDGPDYEPDDYDDDL